MSSVHHSPPKCAFNPDLPTVSSAAEDSFINLRKRKQPLDENMTERMLLLEQKFEHQMSIFSRNIDEMIADYISKTLNSIIKTEFSKVSDTLNAINVAVTELKKDNAFF
jgi:hypothetical protein